MSEPRDRYSELPDSLIFEIFWLLPMTDVVRTTILSKRWKDLWTGTPYLNFSHDNDTCVDLDEFPIFVDLALLSWRGVRIQKLKIDHHGDWSITKHHDAWLRFAVDKNVQELYVHGDAYLVPQCVYSCSSLESLSIRGCHINAKGNVKWNRLKSLRIERVCLVGCEQLFQRVLCGSPHLEVLILSLCNNKENLSILSHTLKKLSIDNYVQGYALSEDSFDTVLTIWSPNLETLSLSGVPYSKCLLLDVSSLTDATLGFDCFRIGDLFDDPIVFLRHLLSAIPHVERLTFSDWCTEVLVDVEIQPLVNVKFLKLRSFFVEYELMANVLEIFPNLNMLVLENDKHGLKKFDDKSSLEFEADIPKSFMQQLRTFEITCNHCDNSVFPFIEIVLKYASSLKKMVMRVSPTRYGMPPLDSLFSASKKLLGMPRSSPNCRVFVI